MANLVSSKINGDARVTGTIFGTHAGNYGECTVAAATAAKTVTISGFTLTSGAHVYVKFANGNSVASPTLNVSGTGAKAMYYKGAAMTASHTLAGKMYEFVYDGTNWNLVGDLDTNTQTVTGVKGNSESSYRTGNVNITAANIGLGNVNNTSDADKPISTATQTALDAKADKTRCISIADSVVNNLTQAWYKVAETVYTNTSARLVTSWLVSIGDNNNVTGSLSFFVDLIIASSSSGSALTIHSIRTSPISKKFNVARITDTKIRAVVTGSSGNATVQIYVRQGVSGATTVSFRELTSGTNAKVDSQKRVWTYYEYWSSTSGETTEPTGTSYKDMTWVFAKELQTAVSDPTASGTALSFIDSITQNENGEITPTKKSVKMDTTPMTSSTNAVTSGGIKTALDNKADKVSITGATKCKITYNSQGIVSAGADLAESDIPNLSESKITTKFDTRFNSQAATVSGRYVHICTVRQTGDGAGVATFMMSARFWNYQHNTTDIITVSVADSGGQNTTHGVHVKRVNIGRSETGVKYYYVVKHPAAKDISVELWKYSNSGNSTGDLSIKLLNISRSTNTWGSTVQETEPDNAVEVPFGGTIEQAIKDDGGNTISSTYMKATSGTKALSWGSDTTIGTVGGTDVKVKMPSVPVDDDSSDTTLASFDDTNKRLILEDVLFVSKDIYPSVGKYGLAIFGTQASTYTTSTDDRENPEATEFAGDREWLLDWRPYLVDMSPVAGETAKVPVAELQRSNWLRKANGEYAPVAGITSAQSTACNVELYWDSAHTKAIRSDIAAAYSGSTTTFQPAAFWEYVNSSAGLSTANTRSGASYSCAIEVKLYNSSGTALSYGAYNGNHIVAPWETTETKYSVFIGRPSDCYVVDGYYATTGEYIRGLTAKPLPVGSGGFDPEDFRLVRTGISPGPSTTVGTKIRNFFYNYNGADNNTKGNAGTCANSIFVNNGTYPRTVNAHQYNNASWARACNSGGSAGNAVPVGEGGFHALNAFLCSVEAGFGTRNLANASMFSSGVSSNDAASAANGGLKVGSTYYKWDATNHGLGNTNNASQAINGYYSKFQCMEPQIALSIAVEMGLGPNVNFKWNGGTWHYELPTAVSGYGIVAPLKGEMNCRMYKLTDTATINSLSVQCNLRCALVEGVNPVGDIWWYMGGGAELVFNTTGTTATSFTADFYLEPDQTKWYSGANTAANTTISMFSGKYRKLVTGNTVTGDTYCKSRTGYTPVPKTVGASLTKYDCHRYYARFDEGSPSASGETRRRRVVLRGNASNALCSPRYLNPNNWPAYTHAILGCAAQVLLA